MKKIIYFLKKVGILRAKKGDYNAMDSYNSSDDFEKGDEKEERQPKGFLRILSKFLILVVLLFLLFSFLILGFNFWFLLIFFIWIWFLGAYYGFLPAKLVFFTKWGMFYFSFVLTIIFIFIGVPDQGSDKNNNREVSFNGNQYNSSLSCEAKNFEFKKNENISTYISSKSNEVKEYTLDELKKKRFETKLLKDGGKVYLLSQICRGNELISDLTTSAVNPSMAGEKKGFTNMNFFDDFIKSQKIKPGQKYQLYGYYSYDGKTWFVSDKLEIEVKK